MLTRGVIAQVNKPLLPFDPNPALLCCLPCPVGSCSLFHRVTL